MFRQLDLASFSSIREFADCVLREESHIDVLVNNAGVFMMPLRRSRDGVEMHLAVNYLGHFLLTRLLLERLREAPSARVVNVAADVPSWLANVDFEDINSERSYNRVRAVVQSKTCVILATRHLSRLLENATVTVNSVSPGLVRNAISRLLLWICSCKLYSPQSSYGVCVCVYLEYGLLVQQWPTLLHRP